MHARHALPPRSSRARPARTLAALEAALETNDKSVPPSMLCAYPGLSERADAGLGPTRLISAILPIAAGHANLRTGTTATNRSWTVSAARGISKASNGRNRQPGHGVVVAMRSRARTPSGRAESGQDRYWSSRPSRNSPSSRFGRSLGDHAVAAIRPDATPISERVDAPLCWTQLRWGVSASDASPTGIQRRRPASRRIMPLPRGWSGVRSSRTPCESSPTRG
jgi:hypothetical protein